MSVRQACLELTGSKQERTEHRTESRGSHTAPSIHVGRVTGGQDKPALAIPAPPSPALPPAASSPALNKDLSLTLPQCPKFL